MSRPRKQNAGPWRPVRTDQMVITCKDAKAHVGYVVQHPDGQVIPGTWSIDVARQIAADCNRAGWTEPAGKGGQADAHSV
jgi:hypothetical protein